MASVAPKQPLPETKRHIKPVPSRDLGIAELAKRPFEPFDSFKGSLPGSYPDTPGNEPEKISFSPSGQQQQGKGYNSPSDVGKPITVNPENQKKKQTEPDGYVLATSTTPASSGASVDQNIENTKSIKFKKPAPKGKESGRYSTLDESTSGVGKPVTLDSTYEQAKNEKDGGEGPVSAAIGVSEKIRFESTPRGKEFEQYTSPDEPSTGIARPVTLDPKHEQKEIEGNTGRSVLAASGVSSQDRFKPAPREEKFKQYTSPDEPSTGVARPITMDPTHKERETEEKTAADGPLLATSGAADAKRFKPAPRGKEFEQYTTPDEPSTGVARPMTTDPLQRERELMEEQMEARTGPLLAVSGAADASRFKPAPRGKEFEQFTTPDEPSTGIARPITLDPLERERKLMEEQMEARTGPLLAVSGAADASRFKPAPREKRFEQFTTPDEPSTGVARPITLDPLEIEKENQKTPVVFAASNVADQNKFKPAPRGEEFEQYSTSDDPSTGVARPITLQGGRKTAETPETPEQNETFEQFPKASDPGSTGVGKPVSLDPFERADAELFGVNPIPASSGIGNPIALKPGEEVPHPSTFTTNTVQSTVRTDRGGYEQDASAPVAPEIASSASMERKIPLTSSDLDPDNKRSSIHFSKGYPFDVADTGDWQLPSLEPTETPTRRERRLTDTGIAIHSAAPTATTAELAAEVPKEKQSTTSRTAPDSGIGTGVEKVASSAGSEESRGQPDEDVPSIVKESMGKAHRDAEAAGSHAALEDKKMMENELLRYISVDESAGTPAPTASAASMERAPRPTAAPGAETKQLEEEESRKKLTGAGTYAPRSTAATATATADGPTVSTGVAEAKTSEQSGPKDVDHVSPKEQYPAKGEYQTNERYSTDKPVKGQYTYPPKERRPAKERYPAKDDYQATKDNTGTRETGTTGPAAAAAAAAASQAHNPQAGTGVSKETMHTKPSTTNTATANKLDGTKPAKETSPDGNTTAQNVRDEVEKKRRHRGSGFFTKIKEMLK